MGSWCVCLCVWGGGGVEVGDPPTRGQAPGVGGKLGGDAHAARGGRPAWKLPQEPPQQLLAAAVQGAGAWGASPRLPPVRAAVAPTYLSAHSFVGAPASLARRRLVGSGCQGSR